MFQWLIALTAFAEDLGWYPEPLTTTCNSRFRESYALFWPLWVGLYIIIYYLLLFWLFKTRFLSVALAALKLKILACFCLPSAGFKGVRHHRPPQVNFLLSSFTWENCVNNDNEKQCAESIHRGTESSHCFNDQIVENFIFPSDRRQKQ